MLEPITDKKIAAFTGFIRSGKNSFANFIEKELKDSAPNLVVEQFSFAEHLRQELFLFINDNFNIDAFTEDDKEKAIIRPLLIAYGNAKRQISNNQYWIEKIHKKIARSNCDVALITDLRFAETEDDELGWLKKNRGFNFHIKRYKRSYSRNYDRITRVFEKAPNEFEKRNDPKLEASAKKVIELERFKDIEDFYKAAKEEVSQLIGFFL